MSISDIPNGLHLVDAIRQAVSKHDAVIEFNDSNETHVDVSSSTTSDKDVERVFAPLYSALLSYRRDGGHCGDCAYYGPKLKNCLFLSKAPLEVVEKDQRHRQGRDLGLTCKQFVPGNGWNCQRDEKEKVICGWLKSIDETDVSLIYPLIKEVRINPNSKQSLLEFIDPDL